MTTTSEAANAAVTDKGFEAWIEWCNQKTQLGFLKSTYDSMIAGAAFYAGWRAALAYAAKEKSGE